MTLVFMQSHSLKNILRMGFSILGTFIPYYGLCILIGLVCASLLGYFLCKKSGLDLNNFILIAAYLFAFGFAGAKIFYILVSFKKIDFSQVFKSMENFNLFFSSGFVFYGGLLGGILGLLFIKKVHKINLYPYVQILAPCLSLAHAFGRIGCSLAGCCHGKETDFFLFFKYKESLAAPNGVKLFPVQGFESAFLFLLTIFLVFLLLKKSKINTALVYILTYSAVRFVLEFFRGDEERGKILFLSTSQFVSLALIIFVVSFWIFSRKSKKISENEFSPS